MSWIGLSCLEKSCSYENSTLVRKGTFSLKRYKGVKEKKKEIEKASIDREYRRDRGTRSKRI